jgi:hypothetical protein
LITELTTREKNQEKHYFQTWQHSECEKFLSGSISLPDETNQNLRLK